MKLYTEPAIIIAYSNLRMYILEDIDYFRKELEEMRKRVKLATGYQYDNSCFRTSSIYGTEFPFHLSLDNLHLWDIHSIVVAEENLSKDVELRRGALNRISKKIDLYDKGIITCSKCHEEIEMRPVRGNRFYAGIYCNDCWEGGVRQQEAKENYN